MIESLRDILKKAQSLQSLVSDRPHVKPAAFILPSAIPFPTLPFPDQLLASVDSLQLPLPVSRDVKTKVSEKICMGQRSFLQSYRRTCEGLLATPCSDHTLDRLCRLYESIYQDQFLPKIQLLVSRIPCSSFPSSQLEKKRTAFNARYTPMLQKYFELNAYPSAKDRQTLADKSLMTLRQIEVWFQNHRNRSKKEGKDLPRLETRLSPFQIAPEMFEVPPQPSTHPTDTSGYLSSEEESESDNSDHYTQLANEVPSILDDGQAPSHAFPTPFSACKENMYSNLPGFLQFPPSLWMRRPASCLKQNPTKIDMEGFVSSFAALNFRDPIQKKKATSRKSSIGPWYSSRVTFPIPAPHPALLRRTSHKPVNSPFIALLPFSSNSRAFLDSADKPPQLPHSTPFRYLPNSHLPTSPSSSAEILSSPRSRVSSSSSTTPSLAPSTPPLSPTFPSAVAPFAEEDFGVFYDLLDLRSFHCESYNCDSVPKTSRDPGQFFNFPRPVQLLAQ